MKKHELEKSFITSISFGTIIVGCSKILSFVLKILVSKLGVINFSDYYLSTSTFSGLTTITALGIPMSTTRYISFYRGENRLHDTHAIITSAFTITATSSIIAAIALYTGAHYLASSVGAPHAAVYFRVLSFGLVGATITILSRAVFLGYIRIRLAYAAEAIEVGCKFLFTIVGVLVLKWGVFGALIGYTTGTLTASIINLYVMVNMTKISHFAPKIKSEFIRFALPVSASEIVTASMGVVLLYIVRLHSGAETIGLYGAATSIAALIHVIPQMIFSIFLPTASRLYAQKKSVLPIYKTLLVWLCVVVLPPVALLSWLSSSLTSVVFGSSYVTSAPILTVLAMAYGIYALLVWPNRQILDMAGCTKENFSLTLVRVCVTGISLYGIFPAFDGVSLAMAIFTGWLAEAVGSIILVKAKHLL